MVKEKVAIAHTTSDIGDPGSYSWEQLDIVNDMIRHVAEGSMGGMDKIVKDGA